MTEDRDERTKAEGKMDEKGKIGRPLQIFILIFYNTPSSGFALRASTEKSFEPAE